VGAAIRRQISIRYAPYSRTKPTAARFVPVGISRDVGVVIFLEDFSRIQQQAQQLKLASLGRLTANIAHEIRNPLSAINHATELLLEEPGLRGQSHARMLQIIHDNTQRLDRMVQDVLKLNRRDQATREHFQAGHVPAHLRFRILGDRKDSHQHHPHRHRRRPGRSLRSEPPQSGDVNLCRNALRYSRKQPGSILLRVRPVHDRVR